MDLIPPLRTCTSKDFGTRADQANFSKAKKVVLALLSCLNVLNHQVVSMDVPARIALFQGCLAALCQRHLALSDQAAVAKRRVSEMSYHSIIAHTQRYNKAFTILSIDLSRAFDTTDREKLLQVLEQIDKPDQLRLLGSIRFNPPHAALARIFQSWKL
ncbi:hypothetical protein H257_13367 [Aphanomyces astaci]|uniref:Reverse transcriptase domain-containing protein n=1 Tax=Aphanomyces astaci TaxID=112090 RepID=W4FVH9_APHAT|nr:hypothetical protein H257_13367 [Aphanomyces astaci]ETV71502.1 hypothetical protein H257_13367 [Aphanomyces astaci]|eukprot:XP_009839167.1 hypothetical protein H257_13367 [Aphanomyces astaci]